MFVLNVTLHFAFIPLICAVVMMITHVIGFTVKGVIAPPDGGCVPAGRAARGQRLTLCVRVLAWTVCVLGATSNHMCVR